MMMRKLAASSAILMVLALSGLANASVGPALSPASSFETEMTHLSETADRSNNYGYCRLAMPGERDNNSRYCDGSYGVMFDGYIVDNACYNILDSAYQRMGNLQICNFVPPVRMGYCQMINPNQRDATNRFCDGTYGFTHSGFIVDDSCYSSTDQMINQMRNTRACSAAPYYANCQIIQPNQKDAQGRYCDKAYGVLYRGYIVDNSCYHSIDQAMDRMQNADICRH